MLTPSKSSLSIWQLCMTWINHVLILKGIVEDSDYDNRYRVLKKDKPDSKAFAKGTTTPSTHQPTGTTLVLNQA